VAERAAGQDEKAAERSPNRRAGDYRRRRGGWLWSEVAPARR
jgi:hypothetical protein